MGRYLICVTGASGAPYARRSIEALAERGHEVHVVFSTWGERVFLQETGLGPRDWLASLGLAPERLYAPDDLSAPPASGSWLLDGTAIVPCSMASLGAIASGASMNLVHRAAAVALKEGRRLVVVPRETPLSLIALRNLTTLAEAGAAVLPACPAFYQGPRSLDDLVDFIAGRILDRLGVPADGPSATGGSGDALYERWQGAGKETR